MAGCGVLAGHRRTLGSPALSGNLKRHPLLPRNDPRLEMLFASTRPCKMTFSSSTVSAEALAAGNTESQKSARPARDFFVGRTGRRDDRAKPGRRAGVDGALDPASDRSIRAGKSWSHPT